MAIKKRSVSCPKVQLTETGASAKIEAKVEMLPRPFKGKSLVSMLRNRTLLSVSLAVCVAYIGIGMVVPVRVLYAQSQGASLAIIGAMASAYLISNFIFQYPSGWLADHWGRKPMMVVSLIGQAALSLLYLFITDPIFFVVLRFVEGIFAAAFLPSARAQITDSITPEKRGEAFGIFGAFFNAGFLFGPALGGLLAGTGYASAFIGAVIFRLVGLVIVFIMIKPGTQQKQTQQAEKLPLKVRELVALPLIGAYLLTFGDFLYVGFDVSLVPLWMTRLGASVFWIGVSYMCWSLPGILLAPFTGKLADRKRRSMLILFFGLAQVPLYVAYGLASSFWLILPLFVLHGTVWIFVQPAVDSHLANASAGRARARIQGLYACAGLLGAFIGASGFSYLYAWNFHSPLFAIGLGYGSCVVIGSTLIRLYEQARAQMPTHSVQPPTTETSVADILS
ncbi:MAG TPA: MFS transporter [Ktedonobacteraceae bacterium]|nr:MFS transporter [Ktedonobacteraceae bacterium]